MPLSDIEWSTSYPGAQDADPIGAPGNAMETLINESAPGADDGHRQRVSMPHAVRDKLHDVCKFVGDTNRLPANSLRDQVYKLIQATLATQGIQMGERLDPGNIADTGFLYVKDDGGDTELFYIDDSGNVVQITQDGALVGGAPALHAPSHKSAGGDPIKLDELAAPTDVATLNATTGQHGLLPKLGGGTVNFLRADGTWAAPSGGGGFSGREQEFTAVGGDEDFQLTVAPAANVNMLSGYNILGVFRNSGRLRYQAAPATGLEFGYTHGGGTTREINCKSLTAGDVITVVYSE